MIMIKAVVRPEKADAVLEALLEAGYSAVTKVPVFGRGKQSANTTLGYGSAANSALDAFGSGFGSGSKEQDPSAPQRRPAPHDELVPDGDHGSGPHGQSSGPDLSHVHAGAHRRLDGRRRLRRGRVRRLARCGRDHGLVDQDR